MNHHHDPTGELLRILLVNVIIGLGVMSAAVLILDHYLP